MAYFAQQQQTAIVSRIFVNSDPILLDGTPISQSKYTSIGQSTAVKSISAIYDEASDSNTGINIYIGKTGHPAYFASYTSETSQALGAVRTVTMIPGRLFLNDGESLTFQSDCGKTGTGVVRIQIEMEIYR